MRWLAFLRRGRTDREIADEIAAHLEMATRDRIERGESPADARFAAMRELGNLDQVREETRRVWTSTAVEQLLQDLRFGSRILWHSPGLSASAVLLIALVIGGNTTVYSAVHRLLTAAAPGVTTDRLVGIGEVSPGTPRFDYFTSYPNFLDYATRSATIQRFAAWADEGLTIGVDGASYAVFGSPVTTNYFDTLGVRIAIGRGFRDDDDRLEQSGLVAVISDQLWRERFRQSLDIVGQSMTVNGQPATIVGVAAPRFRGGNRTPGEELWLPMTAFHQASGTSEALSDRRRASVVAVGQLAPGTSLSQARAELAALAAQLAAAYPDENKDRRVVVFPYSATAFLPFAHLAPRFLAIFSVVTVLTLLIVSANVANLMLARAVVRQRETAVRQSLGASRGRILRLLLAEGLTISAVALAVAFAFAWWMSWILVSVLPPPQRQGLMPDLRPDWQVAAYAMALAMIATLAFTLAPALRTWRQQLLPWLKAGEQAIAPGRSRISSALVVVQLAFSVLLLTTAGLAHRSLSLLDSGDVGFRDENLLLVTLRTGPDQFLPTDRPVTAAERDASFALLERVRVRIGQVHDVAAVTYTRRVPGPYLLAGTPVSRNGRNESVSAMRRLVGPNYLSALGLTVVAGRDLNAGDRRGTTRVAVLSQRLATMLFPGQSPLGQTVQVGSKRQEEAEVIGIAPDALFDGPTHDPHPAFIFFAEQQLPDGPTVRPTFFVRYQGALDAIAPQVGKVIAEVDSQLPIVEMRTMTAQLETVTVFERQIATMLLFFAGASLLVAALGQYAITAFNMRRRTRDFGVRLALGASAQQIKSGVLRDAFRLTIIGLAIGFALSVAVSLSFRSVLFGITPTDPATYVGVFVLLALACLVASYLPAWRAGRVNVVEALRQE
jgi:putative ABC transport system permease protein